jgi:hypothetical protein
MRSSKLSFVVERIVVVLDRIGTVAALSFEQLGNLFMT